MVNIIIMTESSKKSDSKEDIVVNIKVEEEEVTDSQSYSEDADEHLTTLGKEGQSSYSSQSEHEITSSDFACNNEIEHLVTEVLLMQNESDGEDEPLSLNNEQDDVTPDSSSQDTKNETGKNHKCEQCGREFQYHSRLLLHVKIHSEERAFSCYDCGKSFCRQSDYTRHASTHTGFKAYKCTKCDKSFSHNSYLTKHMRIHGVKLFQCQNCDKAFYHSSDLTEHDRTHTGLKPYKCPYCARSFSQNGNLIRHIRSHTGERCYVCSHCGKSFVSSSDRNKHSRIHTGIKPYQCEHCQKKFTQNSNLARHLVRMHFPKEGQSQTQVKEEVQEKSILQ